MVSVEDALKTAAQAAKAPKAPAKKAEAPYILATFKGEVYVPKGTGLGTEAFEVEAKVPHTWLRNNDFLPNGLFRKFIAARILQPKTPGYSGIHTADLVATSELPADLTEEQWLRWQTDMNELAEFARQRVSKANIKVELYPTASLLRRAILRAMAEPEAFDKEQEARSTGSAVRDMSMEAELAALG